MCPCTFYQEACKRLLYMRRALQAFRIWWAAGVGALLWGIVGRFQLTSDHHLSYHIMLRRTFVWELCYAFFDGFYIDNGGVMVSVLVLVGWLWKPWDGAPLTPVLIIHPVDHLLIGSVICMGADMYATKTHRLKAFLFKAFILALFSASCQTGWAHCKTL